MSLNRRYFRKVKNLALEYNSLCNSTSKENAQQIINQKWLNYCKINPKASPKAFTNYIALCQ